MTADREALTKYFSADIAQDIFEVRLMTDKRQANTTVPVCCEFCPAGDSWSRADRVNSDLRLFQRWDVDEKTGWTKSYFVNCIS